MRRGQIYLISIFIVVVLAGSIVAYRLWNQQQRVQSTLASLPIVPDLSRWPAEFRDRVASLMSTLSQGKHPEQALGELARLYLVNDYTAEAEKVFRVLRQHEPQNPRWPYFLGILRLRSGDKIEAEKFFGEAIKLAPEYPPALLQWGDLLAAAGRTSEAKDCFERRLHLLPNDSSSLFSLAKLDHAQGDDNAAMERLSALVARDPKFQEAHLMLGDLLEKKGDLTGAAKQRAFLRGGQASPPVPDAWLDDAYLLSYDVYRLQAFGAIRMQGGQFEKALPYLQRALLLNPSDADVQNLLAQTYSDLGSWNEAQSTLEAGLNHVPESEVLHARLADVLVQKGQPTEALTHLQATVDRFPKKALLRSTLGRILLQLGRGEEAVDQLRAALQLDPVLVDAQLNLGRALLKVGKRAEAKAAVASALKMRPDDQNSLGMLAALDLEDGQLDAAEQHAQRLVSIEPTQAEARDLFARVKLQKGNALAESARNAEAEAIYRQGIAINSGFGQLYGALGMLYGKERRFPEAIAEFRRYLELSPSDPLGYILLGSAYAAVGQTEDARTTWTQGLAMARYSRNADRISHLEHLLKSPGD